VSFAVPRFTNPINESETTMATAAKTVRGKFNVLEQKLWAQREALVARFAQQRSEVFVTREPDDEGAEANENLARHLALAALDRDRRLLNEIESALKRLKAGQYGICDVCEQPIPDIRLRALPWTRVCVSCAENLATGSSRHRAH
jgi:RNA polymerase-binding transcription factor